jgi:site-specific recombinase XerD
MEAAAQAEAFNKALDQWYAGEAATPARADRDSIASINHAFQTDDAFKRLAERTKRDYLYNIKPAVEWAGDVRAEHLTRRAVKAWYQEARDTVGASSARNRVAALRRLLTYAVDEEIIERNPAAKMRITTPVSRARLWTLAERDTFVACAIKEGRPSMALAVMLGWCLGQRPADLRTLPWSSFDGQAVALRQAKTKTEVWVPALPELRRLLAATKRVSTQIVVSEVTQKPYQESDFQHTFADLRAKAGLPKDLQYRDLRRTLATALGAAGCTDDQIRSITGHKTREVVGVYVRPDQTFAKGAMQRLRKATKKNAT